MTVFENKGCELQMACNNVPQAVKTFQYSCRVCCERGVRVSCDHCAIAITHEIVCSAIADYEEFRRQKEVACAKRYKMAL